MNKLILLVFGALAFFVSCADDSTEYDPYTNWQERNESWFRSVRDSATTAIAQAKAVYGDAWESHCQWRAYKRLDQSQDYNSGRMDDSIYVRVDTRGTGSYSPLWSDTVRICYRGWMMPTTYRLYNQDNVLVDSLQQFVFDQSYYGTFDTGTAAPHLSALTGYIVGFYTALQYMVEGDSWFVYIPPRLAYGSTEQGSLPAYSTLMFHIYLAAVYPNNSGVPDWKAPRRPSSPF